VVLVVGDLVGHAGQFRGSYRVFLPRRLAEPRLRDALCGRLPTFVSP
jgi:hypothetical protein